MSFITITCECGHTAPFDAFTSTEVFGELPEGHYQCPCCRRAWKLQPVGEPRIYDCGLFIPADRRIFPIQPVL